MFRQIGEAISRLAQNQFLAAQGIGSCAHCQNHWGVVEGEDIPYTSGRSMFPVCTNCFKILSVDQIIIYVNKLVDLWISQSPTGNYDGVRESAADAVRRMKQQSAA